MKRVNKLLFLIAFCLVCNAVAADQRAVKTSPVRLVTGEFAPFVGEKLNAGGMTARMMRQIFKAMGLQISLDFRPWKRGYQATLRNEYTATFPYSKNAEREEIWWYSDELYNLDEVFFSASDTKVSFDSHQDLAGRAVCKPIGYNLFELEELYEQGVITLERPTDMQSCFRMLMAGRVDLVMTNRMVGDNLIQELNLEPDNIRVLSKPFRRISHHLIVPKSLPEGKAFIAKFNRHLSIFREENPEAPYISPSLN